MKGFSAKCIALKADNYVIEQENILFAGTSEQLSARKFLAVKGLMSIVLVVAGLLASAWDERFMQPKPRYVIRGVTGLAHGAASQNS